MLSNRDSLKTHILICALLITSILAIYWQVTNFDFSYFDDSIYVSENYHVQSGITKSSLKWAFQFTNNSDHTYWHPLTFISHMIDCQLFGLNPGGHHLMSVLFHICNTLLLYFFLVKSTRNNLAGALVATLFALHPINVDSVAWIAERKNVLSTLFWMLSMIAYYYYCNKPGLSRYSLVFLSMGTGLLAKPMLVTLPCALLLLDLWPLERITLDHDRQTSNHVKFLMESLKSNYRLIIEKIPLFALSITWIYISFLSIDRLGIKISMAQVPMNLRVANAVVSYVSYLWKMIWPVNLCVFYPFPKVMPPLWETAGAGLILISITIIVVNALKTKPWLAVGWFWYMGTLAPAMGISQSGIWPAMADRWAYIPLIGIFIMISFSITRINPKHIPKARLYSYCCFTISILMFLTWNQLHYWENDEKLFGHALEITSDNEVVEDNLGASLLRHDKIAKAVRHLSIALKLAPDSHQVLASIVLASMGQAMKKKGKLDKAAVFFFRSLEINPRYAKCYSNLALIYSDKKKLAKAIKFYQKALILQPDLAEAHNNYASLLEKIGKLQEAREHYEKAIKYNPFFQEAHNNLGALLSRSGNLSRAIKHFSTALSINPDFVDARNNLGLAFEGSGKMTEAIKEFEKVLKEDPLNIDAMNNLGITLFDMKQYSKAIDAFNEGLKINPARSDIKHNLDQAISMEKLEKK